MLTHKATRIASDSADGDHPDDRLTAKALAEIARVYGEVDMASMPQIPDTAPCRLPDSNPDDWFDPFRNSELVAVDPRFIDQIAEDLCEGCPVLAECLIWALANPKQGGILGGMTAKKRDELRRSGLRRPLRQRPPAA